MLWVLFDSGCMFPAVWAMRVAASKRQSGLMRIYDVSLAKFKIPRNPESSNYPSAFTWPHLNLCTDRASDEVSEAFALYGLGFNANKDFDPHHGTHNVSKNTLKHCGLWPHEVFVKLSCLGGLIDFWELWIPTLGHTYVIRSIFTVSLSCSACCCLFHAPLLSRGPSLGLAWICLDLPSLGLAWPVLAAPGVSRVRNFGLKFVHTLRGTLADPLRGMLIIVERGNIPLRVASEIRKFTIFN